MLPKTSPNPAPVKSLTIEQKRQLGLCFWCGEKYGPGHQCKRQLLRMEGLEEEEEVAGEMEATGEKDGDISLHALQGSPSGKKIKVKGSVGKKKLMILIDSRSTHGFLDEATAEDLQCPTQATLPLSITIANGSKTLSKLKCQGFKWTMQGKKFTEDL